MSSQSLKYIEHTDFLHLLFGILEEHFSFDPEDPLPNYRAEDPDSLLKILEFIKNDDYYENLEAKAAYLFVSIIENHIYSNGNKRLAFITCLYFLLVNGFELAQEKPFELRELAIFVADKERNSGKSFDDLKDQVSDYLKNHIKVRVER